LGDLRATRAILELQRLVDAADALQERSDQPSERGRVLVGNTLSRVKQILAMADEGNFLDDKKEMENKNETE
jgi:hypothetical protein